MSATAGEFDPDNTKATGKDKIVSLVLPDAATRIKGGTFNDPTFKGFSSLTRFSAGNIVSIGNYAFSGCSSLTAVSLPAGLTSIGNGAFQNCGGLTTISLPASLTSIGSAFAGCRNLSAIQVDQANRVYADRDGVLFNKAFTELIQYPAGKAGTSYAVPEGVTSIGNSAFYGCSSLRTISLPEGLTSIGQFAFYGCRSLTTVSLPAGLTSIGQSAFSGCSSLTSITLPVSLTSIGDFAFIGCSSLTTVSLPASLTSIGSYAFSGCISLSSITVASPQPPRLNGSLGISGSTIIYFPSASLDTYKNAEGWKNHADRIQAADQTSPGAQAMPVQPPVVVPPPPPPPPEPEPVP
jgi:hypothetical protein